MIKKITFNHLGLKERRVFVFAILMFVVAQKNYAQLTNNRSIFIADNASVYVSSGSFNFGPSPASTVTTKTAINHGTLILASGVVTSGASDSHFVDGYLKTFNTAATVLHVGDNGIRGRVRVTPSASFGVEAAYFASNPSAIGTTFIGAVTGISSVEFWDINGTTNTSVSLSWRASSGIATLTQNNLNNLIIVGWNGVAWEEIPSTVDVTAFFGTASDFTTGSIRTNSAVDLTAFSEFTLGAKNTLSSDDFNNSINYANINSGMLNIESNSEIKNVNVFDLNGRLVSSYQNINSTILNDNFSHASGIYIANIEFPSGTMLSVKLINK